MPRGPRLDRLQSRDCAQFTARTLTRTYTGDAVPLRYRSEMRPPAGRRDRDEPHRHRRNPASRGPRVALVSARPTAVSRSAALTRSHRSAVEAKPAGSGRFERRANRRFGLRAGAGERGVKPPTISTTAVRLDESGPPLTASATWAKRRAWQRRWQQMSREMRPDRPSSRTKLAYMRNAPLCGRL